MFYEFVILKLNVTFLNFRHEYDVVRHIETLIPQPKRPCIPCSHLRDKYNFRTIITTTKNWQDGRQTNFQETDRTSGLRSDIYFDPHKYT